MRIGDYETHPAADVFPMMEGDEFKKFVEDIREHGLHHPIVRIWVDDPMYHGQRKPLILDGRNRLRAAYEACIPLRFEDYEGDDPVVFVASMNINRRQLDKSQVALALAKLANIAHGSNQHRRASEEGPIGPSSLTLKEAADKAEVSPRQIKRAKAVLKRGAPELVEAVERGDVSISAAAEVARLDVDEQRTVTSKGADAVTAKAAEIREERKAKAEVPESRVSVAETKSPRHAFDTTTFERRLVEALRLYFDDVLSEWPEGVPLTLLHQELGFMREEVESYMRSK
jgi:ParB-like chromosome segregation protein Spo0J